MQILNKDQVEIVSGGVVQCQCDGSGLYTVNDKNTCILSCCYATPPGDEYKVVSATPRKGKLPTIASGKCSKVNVNEEGFLETRNTILNNFGFFRS